MESYLPLLITLMLGIGLLRLLLKPIRLAAKLAFHGLFGFLCLWILNRIAPVSGFYLPINAVTAVIAGIFGVPGIGLIALLELI